MTFLKSLDDLNNLELNKTSEIIRRRLYSLGFTDVKMLPEIPGPIVTGYPLRVTTTSVSKIVSKSEDIALACRVESVDIRRIQGEIVVFVPNEEKKIVDFKENLFWYLQDEEVAKMQLPIPLGVDFHGNKAAIDLAVQPHILIAGSTGSGKSVFESNIIASLSMFHSPEQLQVVVVDTKQLDLVHFEGLEHLSKLGELDKSWRSFKQVIRRLDEWYPMMQRLIEEVDIRSSKIARKNFRNIGEYNENSDEKMPFIVLIIDEFADLSTRDKEARGNDREYFWPKVDLAIGRLTQIARAVGIHVILCTQRSSTKVIYGDLKANLTTRIALKLPSQIDSRTILDEGGAENLLGKGDMLVRAQDKDELQRFHAPFVRLEDIDAVLNHRDMILATINRPRLSA